MSNIDEASVARAMIKRSLSTIVIADHTKIDHVRIAHTCDISDIDLLITDKDIPKEFKNECETLGVKIELV